MRSAYQQFEFSLFERLTNSLSAESKALMKISLEDSEETISFSDIKADPGRVGLDSVLKEVEKLFFIRSLQLPIEALASINTKVLSRYRQRVNSESVWDVKQHPKTIRYGLYSIFLFCRQREIVDVVTAPGLIRRVFQLLRRQLLI